MSAHILLLPDWAAMHCLLTYCSIWLQVVFRILESCQFLNHCGQLHGVKLHVLHEVDHRLHATTWLYLGQLGKVDVLRWVLDKCWHANLNWDQLAQEGTNIGHTWGGRTVVAGHVTRVGGKHSTCSYLKYCEPLALVWNFKAYLASCSER